MRISRVCLPSEYALQRSASVNIVEEQFDMNQQQVFTRLLSDAELHPFLEAKDIIVFDGFANKLEAIYDQVCRLGYGDSYWVTTTKEPPGNFTLLTPNLGYQVNSNPSHGLSRPSLAERPPSALGPNGKS